MARRAHQYALARTTNSKTGVLNEYAWWRYLAILFVVVLGVLYASPNLYPPDYALQIRLDAPSSDGIPAVTLLISESLTDADIPYKSITPEAAGVLVRFASNAEQLRAQAVIKQVFAESGNGLGTVALNLANTTPDWLAQIGGQPMKYGLDLSGGVHFLLEVDIEQAYTERAEQTVDFIKAELRKARLRYHRVQVASDAILAIFSQEQARDAALELLVSAIPEYEIVSAVVQDRPALRLQYRKSALRELEDYAISQNLQSLRNRVNELGVSEPLVQRFGRHRIVLDLPGVQDSAKAKEIIGKVANLEFRMEARANTSVSNAQTYDYEGRTVRLERSIIVTGDRVSNAQAGYDPDTGLPQVNITLDGRGGDLMLRATRGNVGRRMGVIFKEIKTRSKFEEDEHGVLQEQLTPYSVHRMINLATVQATLGNRFRITGLVQSEAQDLALLLRAGALAAPMYIVEERTVGASLGQENIDAGVRAVALGLVLVLVFMALYFRVFGLVADFALFVNLMLLVALMSVLGATLTLPGIAGIVLTVGMAVDANVLIFSRIREEIRENQPPQMAIHTGFERALVAILDANVTTFIVAIILYVVGTGPVKGFAVTLSIGILTSMFSAVLMTRALINLIYGHRDVRKLMI